MSCYRPPEEVFDVASLASFTYAPVTLGHPSGERWVTAANWRKVVVGYVAQAFRDGEFVGVILVITNDRAARAIATSEARELSVGHDHDLLWSDGVAPDGTPYSVMEARIAVNHVALVASGAQGPDCRLLV